MIERLGEIKIPTYTYRNGEMELKFTFYEMKEEKAYLPCMKYRNTTPRCAMQITDITHKATTFRWDWTRLARWVDDINKFARKSWKRFAQNREDWRKGKEAYALQ